MKNTKKKETLKHIFKLLLLTVINIGLFFAAAGTFSDMRGNIYVSIYFISTVISNALLFFCNQNSFIERGKKRENTKKWDKFLLPVILLLTGCVIFFIAGLGIRFDWGKLPIECFYAGIILYLSFVVFSAWAVLENKHFEATSRIQNDRKQVVVTSGPYKIVRHPGYAGAVFLAIANYLIFGTLAVGIVSFVIIAVFCIRTYLEDKMLKEELAGYLEYSQTVKYRLIPFVW